MGPLFMVGAILPSLDGAVDKIDICRIDYASRQMQEFTC